MRLTPEEFELLNGLLKNNVFFSLLYALAASKREYTLNEMISSHNVQNVQAAAIAASKMSTLEQLPQLFIDLLNSQTSES